MSPQRPHKKLKTKDIEGCLVTMTTMASTTLHQVIGKKCLLSFWNLNPESFASLVAGLFFLCM